jgi:SAM-dependent methyltransferase
LRRGLAFLTDGRPQDYGARLARLRWTRALGLGEEAAPVRVRVVYWAPDAPAAAALEGAESWIFVPDPESLPLPGPAGTVHTLRELEGDGAGGSAAVAVAFNPADLRPSADETIKIYIRRLLDSNPALFRAVPSFSVGDPSTGERPEVVERLPLGDARILDIGCGAGGLGLAVSSRPGWRLTGVEKDPLQAGRARALGGYERVFDGGLEEALPRLAAERARFDAIVFADVLEHVEDPVEALRAARALAEANGRLLAVVPNAGHLSVVRDLLLGRHDPVPAGLCDAGHLRWFTKAFLAETIEEAGWTIDRIEGLPGAPPPDPGPFLELAKAWPEADLESLGTYQWVATARAGRSDSVEP